METLNTCSGFLTDVMNNHSKIALSEPFRLFIHKFSYLLKMTNSDIKVKIRHKGKKCLYCRIYILQANSQKAIALSCNPNEHFFCSIDCFRRHSLACTNFTLIELNYITCPACRVPISPNQISEAFDNNIDQFRTDTVSKSLLFLLNNEEKKQLESTFSCEICLGEYNGSQGITLKCDHQFCENCAKSYVADKIESAQVSESNFTCPKCQKAMNLNEIEDLAGPELFEKYQKFLLRGFKVNEEVDPNTAVFQCPGADCEFFCIYEKGAAAVQCQKCFLITCVECKEKYHPNSPCDKLKANLDLDDPDRLFHEMMAKEGIIKCPNCGTAVQRIAGCEFMVCSSSVCQGRTYFCYNCGMKLQADHAPHPCSKFFKKNDDVRTGQVRQKNRRFLGIRIPFLNRKK